VTAATRTGSDVLLDTIAGRGPMPPAAELLGWEALSIEPGRVRVRYTALEAFYNPMGTVQGGFLAAMLDDAMGPALFTLLDEGQHAPTLEMKVSFMRPAYAGPLIAEGRVAHKGRSVAFVEGELRSEDGQLVATATATLRIATANGNGSEPSSA
jgi:uncharacterized protein (TIGR00369 family)